MSRPSRLEAMLITSWVMTVSTFQLFVAVVLAATVLEELDISRWQLGVLGAVNTGVGAMLAPTLGRFADRIGARRAMVLVVLVSAAGLAVTAAAVTYWLLVLGSAIAGIPQGAGNPVTNKVIVEDVPAEAQGSVTGVKQSGVQFSVFLSGIMLPASAATIGWRPAVALFAGFIATTGLLIHLRLPQPPIATAGPAGTDRGESADRPRRFGRSRSEPLEPFVTRVALYALLLGMAAGGITRFYPLFAQEVLSFSEAEAGLAVSVTGLTAIAARLLWASIVDRLISSATSLKILGVGGGLTAALLLASEGVATWILWPAVVLAAFTVVAWNVVAMLAVIRSVPAERQGRATGIVLSGFLGGLTASAPAVGFVVDRVDSYQPAWIALGILSIAGAAVVGSARPATRVLAN